MKLVDKQVVRELVGPFVFGVMAFSSVFFAGSYLLELTEWIMKGMPIWTAMEIVILTLPSVVVYTLPMATLLAVLMGIGRMSGDSETVALFAGGTSLYRIAIPIFVLGLVVSLGSIALNELVAPWANTRNKELQAVVLKQESLSDKPFSVADPGTDSWIIVNGGMDVEKGILRDVTIVRPGKPGMVMYAKRAIWTGLHDRSSKYGWQLFDGYSQVTGGDSSGTMFFNETETREIEINKTPADLSLFQKEYKHMSFSELTKFVAYQKAHPDRSPEDIRKLETERWNKLALPLSSLVFAMLATPLGIRRQRSGSSVGLGLSIFVIFIYWMVWHYTSNLARQGSMAPIAGAFAADILGLIAAIILLKRAAK